MMVGVGEEHLWKPQKNRDDLVEEPEVNIRPEEKHREFQNRKKKLIETKNKFSLLKDEMLDTTVEDVLFL